MSSKVRSHHQVSADVNSSGGGGLDDSANWSAVHSSTVDGCSRPTSSSLAAPPMEEATTTTTANVSSRLGSRPSSIPPRPSSSSSTAKPSGRASSPSPHSRSQTAMERGDHQASAFGQLVVQNAKAQQTIAQLRKENHMLETSSKTLQQRALDLEQDVSNLTRQLASRERDYEELRYENSVLRQKLENQRCDFQNDLERKDSEWREVRSKLEERSGLASHFFYVSTGLMQLNSIIESHYASKETAFLEFAAESSVLKIKEVAAASEAAQAHALAAALREHELTLKGKEEKLNAILQREQAQHDLTLQSYESQIADLERKLRSQSAMITQQRRHEAVLRGVVSPDVVESDDTTGPIGAAIHHHPRSQPSPQVVTVQQQPQDGQGHLREASAEAIPGVLLHDQGTLSATATMGRTTSTKESVPAVTTTGSSNFLAGRVEDNDDVVGPLPLRPPPAFRASRSRSPSPPLPTSASGPAPAPASVPHLAVSGAAATTQVPPSSSYSRAPTTTTTHSSGTPQLSKMDQVDLGLAACLRQLSRSARR